jgi:orotidine-5'-phosphate decarboxylase
LAARLSMVVPHSRAGQSLMKDARDRLIVALDVSSAADAQRIVSAIGDAANIYKVGKQLFTAEGPQAVRDLVASGRKVFLDLKFHDIPNTVAAAVAEAAKLNVSMLTVHASGGGKMLRAAVEAASKVERPPLVLAVTVLTSMEDSDLPGIGVRGTIVDQALRLATMAITNGCDGIVTSAHEVRELRSELGDDFAIVTPGVRPAGSAKGDQARVVTPAEAISAGATHIVVGRPITAAPDPAAAAKDILQQINF